MDYKGYKLLDKIILVCRDLPARNDGYGINAGNTSYQAYFVDPSNKSQLSSARNWAEWTESSGSHKNEEGKWVRDWEIEHKPVEFEFENNGRGYCWVCSYAMLFSSSSGEVILPTDIANYNIESGFEGNFMAPHELVAYNFGLELVPALSEDSLYFGGFNLKNRCETSLIVETDEDVVAAIAEALVNFPAGIIVRYEGYPHTMVAVAVEDGVIYFNDPAVRNGEHILFEETCLKNFNLSDISFIQAVK